MKRWLVFFLCAGPVFAHALELERIKQGQGIQFEPRTGLGRVKISVDDTVVTTDGSTKTISGGLNVTGTVTAGKFSGDGSQITGIAIGQDVIYSFVDNGSRVAISSINFPSSDFLWVTVGSSGTLSVKWKTDGLGNHIASQTIDVSGFAIHNATNIAYSSNTVTIDGSTQTKSGGFNVSGNMGVGTTAPTSKADIVGQLTVQNNATNTRLVGTDHTYISWFPDGVAAGRKGYTGYPNVSVDDFTIANEISGAHIVLLPTGGNVGIGNASPAYKLEVSSNVYAVRYQTTQASNSEPFGYSLAPTVDLFSVSADAAKANSYGMTRSGNDVLLTAFEDLRFLTNNDNEFLTIKQNGLVGVNTTAPGATFDVGGRIRATGSSGDSSSVYELKNFAGNIAFLYLDNSGNLNYESAVAVNRFFVASGGNVGIGNTNPTTELKITATTPEISFGDANYDTESYNRIGVASAIAAPQYVFYNSQNAYHDGLNWVHVQPGGFSGRAVKSQLYSGTWGVSVTTWTSSVIGWDDILHVSNAGQVGVKNTSPSSALDVAGGSVTSRGASAGYAVDGQGIFISTWSNYTVMRVSSGSIAANTTLTITAANLGLSSIGIPVCGELEDVNTAGTSIRVKDTLSTTSYQVYNSDIVNAKKFTCVVVGKP